MPVKKHLLIVAHNPSPNTQALVEATMRGAQHEDITGVEVRYLPPLQAGADDVLWTHPMLALDYTQSACGQCHLAIFKELES